MRSSHDWQERAAIAEHHGGLSQEEAEAVADYHTGKLDRSQAPDAWDATNKRWRRVVAQLHGQSKMQAAHDALKRKHGVDSFKDLTIEQIDASIERMTSEK